MRTLQVTILTALAICLVGAAPILAASELIVQSTATLPTLDGQASDACWEGCTALKAGDLTLKAVATGSVLAILAVYDGPSADKGAAYQHLADQMPELLPASGAGVETAATWSRGTWTVEVTRPLEASAGVQFTDLTQAYSLTVAGEPVTLTFAGEEPGLDAGYAEEEEAGCYCRTSL